MKTNQTKQSTKYDCTDCIHFGVCYLRRHGKTDNVACDDIELDHWNKEEEND